MVILKSGAYAHEGSVGSSSNWVERVPQTPLLEAKISP